MRFVLRPIYVLWIIASFCLLIEKDSNDNVRHSASENKLTLEKAHPLPKNINDELRNLLLTHPQLTTEVDRVVDRSPFLRKKRALFIQKYYRPTSNPLSLFKDFLLYQKLMGQPQKMTQRPWNGNEMPPEGDFRNKIQAE